MTQAAIRPRYEILHTAQRFIEKHLPALPSCTTRARQVPPQA
jgi:hypothetical protein